MLLRNILKTFNNCLCTGTRQPFLGICSLIFVILCSAGRIQVSWIVHLLIKCEVGEDDSHLHDKLSYFCIWQIFKLGTHVVLGQTSGTFLAIWVPWAQILNHCYFGIENHALLCLQKRVHSWAESHCPHRCLPNLRLIDTTCWTHF